MYELYTLFYKSIIFQYIILIICNELYLHIIMVSGVMHTLVYNINGDNFY